MLAVKSHNVLIIFQLLNNFLFSLESISAHFSCLLSRQYVNTSNSLTKLSHSSPQSWTHEINCLFWVLGENHPQEPSAILFSLPWLLSGTLPPSWIFLPYHLGNHAFQLFLILPKSCQASYIPGCLRCHLGWVRGPSLALPWSLALEAP